MAFAWRTASRPLHARGLSVTALVLAAASFVACPGGTATPPEPDGTEAAPWTQDTPNPDAPDPTVHQPVLYASLANAAEVRLWVEVFDPGTGTNHVMEQEHYIKQIKIVDNFGNQIDQLSYTAVNDQAPRLILETEIPDGVTSITVLMECSLFGFWANTYNVEDLLSEPVGDTRRAFTATKPGPYGDLAEQHVPIFGVRPNGKYSIEVGDRAAQKLHVMEEGHYIDTILIFDEYSQLREGTYLSPEINAEPVYDFDPLGAGYLRVVVSCNTHKWWEQVYSLPAAP